MVNERRAGEIARRPRVFPDATPRHSKPSGCSGTNGHSARRAVGVIAGYRRTVWHIPRVAARWYTSSATTTSSIVCQIELYAVSSEGDVRLAARFTSNYPNSVPCAGLIPANSAHPPIGGVIERRDSTVSRARGSVATSSSAITAWMVGSLRSRFPGKV